MKTLNRLSLRLYILAALLMPVLARAQYNYTVNPGGTTITITSYTGPGGALVIPSSYAGYTVTALGAASFQNSGVTSVTLPNTVTNIGAGAFLTSAGLTNVVIPNGVYSIGDLAFAACDLRSVNLPASVTSLGKNPFAGCIHLVDMTVDSGNPAYESVLNVDLVADHYYVLFDKFSRSTIIAFSPGYQRQNGVPLPSFPASVTNIGAFSFAYTHTDVTLPQNTAIIGENAFQNAFSLTSLPLLPNLKSIGDRAFKSTGIRNAAIPSGVTSIGPFTFESCTSLTNIVIPNSVTNIGDGAFSVCVSLGTLNIPDSVRSLGLGVCNACNGLRSAVLGNSLNQIPDATFQTCLSLTNVTIPNSITSIGISAFNSCVKLASITIPNSVTTIKTAAFYHCDSLANVVIPSGVTTIERDTFRQCGKLTSVTIPNTVTAIGDYAFNQCFALNSAPLPNALTSIGDLAFSQCNLTSAVIPNSVTYLGTAAFQLCSNLATVTIGTSVQNIRENAFYQTKLSSVVVPNSVTNIGPFAFFGCSNLISVTLGSSLVSLEGAGFGNCPNLTGLLFPSSLTTLSSNVFQACIGLTTLTMPNNLSTIGPSAFVGCTNLGSVFFTGIAPDLQGGNAGFSTTVNCTIYYPLGPAGWNPPISTWQGRPAVPWDPASKCLLSLAGGVAMVTQYIGPGGAVSLPASLGGFPIRSIGASAFAGSGVTSVTIPEGVLSIEDRAFANCLGLISLNLPDSLTSIPGTGFVGQSFAGCANLVSITFGTNFASLGNSIFSGCSSLQNLYFRGTGVPSNPPQNHFFSSTTVYYPIGGNAGTWSSTFADATVAPWDPNGNFLVQSSGGAITITGYAGSGGAASIPAQIGGLPVVAIAPNAFQNSALTSIAIPDSVTSIGDNAFFHCTSLGLVTMGNGVTNVGVMAFYQCTGLNLINFGSGVTTIGDYAMAECNMLSIFIPGNVTRIGSSCFSGTPAHSIYFKGNAPAVVSIGFLYGSSATVYYVPGTTGWGPIGSTFAGRPTALWSDAVPCRLELTNGALSVTLYVAINGGPNAAVTIPPVIGGYPVTSIGVHAFPAVFMASVTLPDSVRNIGSEAFLGCPYLTRINLGNGVTNIAPSAFQGCTSLNNLTCPASLTTLSASAFRADANLKSIFFRGNAPSLDSQVFPETSATMYYLPGKTGWGTFLGDQPAVLWNPLLQANGSGLGAQGNQFIFRITGAANIPIAIEACTNLANPVWQRLQTGTLTNGSIQLNDPLSPGVPKRFYHVSSP